MLTRRKFIGTTLVAGPALTTSAQQARPQPASKRTIVDAQVHFWKASSPDWPWDPGVRPQLPEPFTIERALPMMDEAGVDRVVIVPPGLNDRNDYALEAAKRYPNRFGVMGRIPLQDPKSAALLPTWKQQPGMLGVRVTFNTPPTLAWLSDGTADWFWPAAEKAGLAVMFLAVGEVPRFAHVAERHPQLTLIIDHMGLNSSSRTNRITEIPAAIDQAIARVGEGHRRERPSYHNTAQPPPSDSPTIFSGSLRFSEWSGEYGDVHFGLLPKTHKRLNGPPLSTGASLHARPWSKVDREARQISDPGKVT